MSRALYTCRTAAPHTCRTAARSRHPIPAAALALVSVLAASACGGRTDVGEQTTSAPPPAGPVTTSPSPSTGPSPSGDPAPPAAAGVFNPPLIRNLPSAVPQPTLSPRTTVTPDPPSYDGPIVTTGSRQDNIAAINATYDTFMADLTGLFHDLDPIWVKALQEVATPQMSLAITRAAAAVQASESHARGTLVDNNRKITIKGDEALVISCLDEQNWYVVKDGTGVPDPGIERGFFRGKATFVFTDGRWFVNTWNSLPQRCPAF